MRSRAREDAMKYMMLIYQGDTPLPGSDAWASPSEQEQKQIYADYGLVNPGAWCHSRRGAWAA
jgi:hypothetical protein